MCDFSGNIHFLQNIFTGINPGFKREVKFEIEPIIHFPCFSKFQQLSS